MLLCTTHPLNGQPPNVEYRTIQSAHFRVTFAPGLESLARHAAKRGEVAYARLTAEISPPPRGRIDVLVSDHTDFANGFASTHPSNRITLLVKPPTDSRGLDYNGDWVDLVMTHELTHIFHLDRAGRVGRALRAVFGRPAFLWPLFPVEDTPTWSIEGLATAVESRFTGFGRVYGTFHEMVVRMAVLENRFDPFERLNASSPLWPDDQRVYIYGSLLLHYLAAQHGSDVYRRIVDRTASAFLPPFLFFGNVGSRAFGQSFAQAYREWHAEMQTRYALLADSLRALGLTQSERLTTHGRYALHARFSPDGGRIAYAADDGKHDVSTRIIDSGGQLLAAYRRNGIGPLAWLPDGNSIVVAQLEFSGPYRVFQDIYIAGSGARRITHAARLQDPDLSGEGSRVAAVENAGGSSRIVALQLGSGAITGITIRDPNVHWAYPRWSPDGTRIAASRWRGGHYDVVVIDSAGSIITELTDEAAVAIGAAWSPDGRWVLFSSDRTGIANLYAADMRQPRMLRQVTNVLGGAFFPDVSPDGRWIIYSAYDADGYHLERMPFDPAAWRDPAPARVVQPAATASTMRADDSSQPVAHGYSPWHTARPFYWEPLYTDGGAGGEFFGIATAGRDLVGRYAWSLSAQLDPSSGRWQGTTALSFARFGNPVFELDAARTWEPLGRVALPDSSTRESIVRQDVVAAFATLLHNRWRSSARLSLGIELEHDAREILGSPDSLQLRDPAEKLLSLRLIGAWANYRGQPYSISREDGVSLSMGGRITRERDETPQFPRDYEEATAFLAAYKTLPLPGFAKHVVALRSSARLRTGSGATPFTIGGISGNAIEVAGIDVSGTNLFLPVRGFERGARAGTRAWTAALEHRVPLALPGRNLPLLPIYMDRASLSLFADAGDATCPDAVALRFRSCSRLAADIASGPLLSAGAELVANLGVSSWFFQRIRVGIAQPVRGPADRPTFYIRFGASY